MPVQRKLPDIEELKELRSQGLTLKEIAAMFDVSHQAVSNAFARAREGSGSSRTYHSFTPWKKIERQHQSAQVMQFLRSGDLIARGKITSPLAIEAYERWVDKLNELGLVVCYDPEAPPNAASQVGGFYYRIRRESDPPGIMQVDP
ncbi:hypothetical protein [Brevibacterium album]|uniref:hypothetical protein n=1 Tax=Brevibacterium album TaxID=417948 RepID=UPI0004911A8E|nr:hypothetical protein [Brevibacterium album]